MRDLIKKNQNIKLYSFDIFDTLITRKTGSPVGIFTILQEKIKDNPSFSSEFKNNFYTIRINCELNARDSKLSKLNTREINFDEIYNQMKTDYNLSDGDAEYLKNLEITTEKENFFAINENLSILKELINSQKRVILISDMYYNTDTLRSFLVQFDDVFKDIKIYVSNEYGASKSEGTIYKIIKEKENLNFKKWLHIGDNKNSDFIQAKKFGINAVKSDFKLEKYEQKIINSYPNDIDVQRLVGFSKFTRLNKQNISNPEKYDFGASFSAPLLYSYVNYILKMAVSNDLKTLYFISRDGYIPKLIADIIIKNKNLPVKTKYIYGSRLAWRIPNEQNYEQIIDIAFAEHFKKFSLELLGYKLGVSPDLFSKYFPNRKFDSILDKKEILDFKNKLLSDKQIKNKIIENNVKKAKLLTEYLKQEIDFSSKDILFVDVNGTARTMEVLSDYMNRIMPCVVHCFYMTSVFMDNPAATVKKHIYFTKPAAANYLLELICRTNTGQTLGYFEKDGKILPIEEETDKTKMNNWGYESYLKGILDFCENISKDEKSYSSLKLCYCYYDYVLDECDKDIAEILADIPFCLIGKENKASNTAVKLNFFQILKYFLFGKKSLKNLEIPDLSLIRSGINIKKNKSLFDFKAKSVFLEEYKLKRLLRSNKSKKIVLWGASLFIEDFIKKYNINYDNIVAVVDRNPLRQEQKIGRYQIISPEELIKIPFDGIILTIKNRNEQAYLELKAVVEEKFKDKKLLPNIFNTSLFSIIKL